MADAWSIPHLAAWCAGTLGGAGLCGLILWWDRRQRRARNERPPQKSKLLRPPGYSLLVRLDAVNERVFYPLLEVIVAGGFLGLVSLITAPLAWSLVRHPDALGQVIRQPHAYLLLCLPLLLIGCALLASHGLLRVHRLFQDARNCRLGMRGEQAVAESLQNRRVTAAGYVAFHDIETDGPGNVDHLVIGPGGVFVIETKTRSKRRAVRDQPECEVRFDGRTLHYPWGDDRRAARQAELNAAWVRRFLGEFIDRDMLIQPVIVIPGWYVKSLGNYPVKAMNEKYLAGYLEGAPRRFTPEQLEPIIARFDERCRTLEF